MPSVRLPYLEVSDRCTKLNFVMRLATLCKSVLVFHAGPCSSAKVDNTELNCDVDGNFVPLQCRRLVDLNGYMCRCVRVVTGEVVPGTERDITDRREAPNCDNIGECLRKSWLICTTVLGFK